MNWFHSTAKAPQRLRKRGGACGPFGREIAIDFQGLIQSALAGRSARPEVYLGLSNSLAREPLAALFYTRKIEARGPHRVERNLQLAEAAGARLLTEDSWLPPGRSEGALPSGPFILTSPLAGWIGKQWPLARYEELGKRLRAQGLELVTNVPAGRERELGDFAHLRVHTSSISGLIDATRRAIGIVGVDSGPLHLASALGQAGSGIVWAYRSSSERPVQEPHGGTACAGRANDLQASCRSG